ncbi:Hypothetical protein NTJ_03343 [Nesidiocoris tenuis]|uniref:Uncharacterized protein n=1 Tax=Nesidiocoris tenuis TaxID=355587 RepID=A0ABN7AE52_9HEMI|nr:Hypothetical protein NTJ_03343 [Nesidiocoris tenuis]
MERAFDRSQRQSHTEHPHNDVITVSDLVPFLAGSLLRLNLVVFLHKPISTMDSTTCTIRPLGDSLHHVGGLVQSAIWRSRIHGSKTTPGLD